MQTSYQPPIGQMPKKSAMPSSRMPMTPKMPGDPTVSDRNRKNAEEERQRRLQGKKSVKQNMPSTYNAPAPTFLTPGNLAAMPTSRR